MRLCLQALADELPEEVSAHAERLGSVDYLCLGAKARLSLLGALCRAVTNSDVARAAMELRLDSVWNELIASECH